MSIKSSNHTPKPHDQIRPSTEGGKNGDTEKTYTNPIPITASWFTTDGWSDGVLVWGVRGQSRQVKGRQAEASIHTPEKVIWVILNVERV